MLVAELAGQIIDAGFAFRRSSQPCTQGVTLRNVASLTAAVPGFMDIAWIRQAAARTTRGEDSARAASQQQRGTRNISAARDIGHIWCSRSYSGHVGDGPLPGLGRCAGAGPS